MLRFFLSVVSLAITLFGSASAAPVSQIIFELTTLREHGGASGIYPEVRKTPVTPWFSVSPTPGQLNPTLALIMTGVTLNDVGQSAVATAATPGFSEFAQFLTDGEEQALHIPYLGAVSERTYFQADRTDEIDLKGYTLDLVKFEILEWYSESPGRDPNGDGFWTSFYLRQRVTIEGHPVPEPSVASLAVFGVICMRMGRLGFRQWRGRLTTELADA